MHPLDPLTAEEVQAAAEIIRRERATTDSWRFASLDLAEPAKADLLAWQPDDPMPRRAFAVCWDRSTNQPYEAVADLTAGRVASWTPVPGVTPNVTVDEYHEVDAVLHEHPEVLAAVARRGIPDPGLVLFDVWTYGASVMPEQWRDRRLGWCDVWLRATPAGNPYAHPVAGLKIIVDLNSLEVLQIEDHHDDGLPEVSGEYDPAVHGRDADPPLKPLMIHQTEGPSFTLDGHHLTWQNWSLRIGFNAREGLVLHQVRFADHGETRDIAYRLSFAEMVVPYRDPGFDHYRRTAFDIGEWGLGAMTTSLELDCDCLGEIVYLDAVIADSRGEPLPIPQAICLHEEDAGVLWKHVDPITGAQSRRMRRMVISFHATVANYEYLVYWRFYADGNIECEVRATGIMVTTPLATDDDRSPYGAKVDARTYAPYHQHFIVARLDLDVDGTANTAVELDADVLPIGPDNPYGLAMTNRATVIASEVEAARDPSWATQRTWSVTNPDRTNAHGDQVAYKIIPTAAIPALFDPASPVHQRAPVIGHTLWVTAYDDAERWPAGDYPTQSGPDTGITRWVAADASLVGADLVLWYVFGIHHITRPEDWPVMPADTVSFWLKPSGFFDHNPALDQAP